MSSRIRALAILELLAQHPEGLPGRDIGTRLGIPRTAAERIVQGLVEGGFAYRDPPHRDPPHRDPGGEVVRLTVKLAALGLAYLGASGITDLVQPILDDLAKRTGELVRLAVIEGERLTWVAKSQSTRSGLFYTPDAGAEVYLPATANGQAWLACLSDREAAGLVQKQGLRRQQLGPNAPETLEALLAQVAHARRQGYATVAEAYEVGTSAIATAIRPPGAHAPIGTVSVAGPSIRMTAERMAAIAPWLISSAEELGAAAAASPLFSPGHR